MPSVNINGMEIFRPGTHNGIEFTEADLLKIEENFQILQNQIRPKLKITHREDQENLAGLASYGDVVTIYTKRVDGELRLFANLERVPEQVAEWIRDGRFSERSIELFLRYTVAEKTYTNVLTAIALLGSEIPAVPGLSKVNAKAKNGVVDIRDSGSVREGVMAATFKIDPSTINFENEKAKGGGKNKMDWETIIKEKDEKIEKLQSDLTDLKAKFQSQTSDNEKAQLKAKIETLEADIQEQKQFKDECVKLKKERDEANERAEKAEQEKAELKKKAKADQIGAIFEKLSKAGKLVPAVKEKFEKLANSLDNMQEIAKFSKKVEGKDVEVGMSQLQLFSEILESLPKVVDFKEVSETDDETDEGDDAKPGRFLHGGDTYETSNEELSKLAKKIMERDSCTFSDALVKASQEIRAKKVTA